MPSNRFLCGLISFFAALALFAAEYDFTQMTGTDCAVFEQTPDDFLKKNRLFFRWTSQQKDSARYSASSRSPGAVYLGFPIQEAIVYFKNDKLTKLYFSVYNRGDSGTMTWQEFDKLVADFNQAMTDSTGEKGEELKGRLASSKNVNAEVRIRKGFVYTVKWSISGHLKKDRVPEYLQLEIERFDPKNDPRRRSVTSVDRNQMETKKDLISNVKREDGGNVWITGIPMVDQGKKGYCVAAVAERVLRYYGCEGVNQHTIAQLTGTDARRGTSYSEMVEALQKAGTKFGIRLKPRYSSDVESIRELEKIVQRYNTIARKMKSKKISIVQKNDTVYVGRTFAQMELPVYQKYRLSYEHRNFNAFKADIRERIDRGMPVIWCVVLGMIRDQSAPQASGGHMRLIIGYNDKKGELIYSDSWGARHEFKTMSYEDAWTITTRTMFITPRAAK